MLSSPAITMRKRLGEFTNSEHDWGVDSARPCPCKWCGGVVAKGACSRGGVHGFCAGIEGVILHSVSCQSKTVLRTGLIVCDTSSLIGNCPDTLVSRQIPLKTKERGIERYLDRYRLQKAIEVPVAETQTIDKRSSEKLRGRDRRSYNLSTKLTTNEAKAVEKPPPPRTSRNLARATIHRPTSRWCENERRTNIRMPTARPSNNRTSNRVEMRPFPRPNRCHSLRAFRWRWRRG